MAWVALIIQSLHLKTCLPILSAKVGRSGKMTQARKEGGKKMQEHGLDLDYYLESLAIHFIYRVCQTQKWTRGDFFNSNQGKNMIYVGGWKRSIKNYNSWLIIWRLLKTFGMTILKCLWVYSSLKWFPQGFVPSWCRESSISVKSYSHNEGRAPWEKKTVYMQECRRRGVNRLH